MPKTSNLMPLGQDVFYRVHLKDGKPFVSQARAWDVKKFQENLARQYMKAKDGPHIVEFISEQEYKEARRK